ncbi:MAG: hypothetical protein RIQ71_1409, partial [Verrucomicrobiota bacterium]
MKTRTPLFRIDRLLIAALALLAAPQVQAQFNLTNASYSQNFNALGTNNFTNNNRNLGVLSNALTGWYWYETGTSSNDVLTAGNGSSSTGDAYNFGSNGVTDRSLGGLQSGNVVPSWGFWFSNSLGTTITNLQITYTGETWRIGNTGRADVVNFSYSGTNTNLAASTWTNFSGLDYTNTAAGATASGSLLQSASISNNLSVSIASGSTFFIRWSDFNATGSDDGMSIDDFSLTAFLQAVIAALNWSGGSGNWDTGFGATVTNGSALSFSGSGGIATNNLVTPLIASMTFSNGAGSYTNIQNAFTISNGIVNNSASQQVFSNAITLGAAQTFDSAAGAMTFAGNVDNGGFRLTVGGASNTVVSGAVSGSGGLTKSGAGTATLSGVNTYSGGTLISAGTLRGDATSLQGLITNNSVIIFDQAADGAYTNILSGSGTLTKVGVATLTLSGANTFTNAMTISNGAVRLANNNASGSTAGGITVASGAALELSNNIAVGTEALALTGTGISSGGALRSVSGSNSYAGVITNTGAVTIAADSGSAMTLSGAINLNSGTMTVAGAGNTLLSGAVTNGSVTKSGNGTVTFSNMATSFGTLTTGTGTTAFATNATITGLAGSGTVNLAGGTLTLTNTSAQSFSGSITGAGGFTKTGAETLTLSGSGSYSGPTTIAIGTILGAANNALSTNSAVTVGVSLAPIGTSRGQLLIGDGFSQAIAGLTLFGGATNTNSGRVTIGTGSTLTVNGNITYENANNGSYPSTISGGTLDLGGGNRTITVWTNGNETIGGDLGIDSVIANGSIVKEQSGILRLSGANTFAGTFSNNVGVLWISNANALQNATLDVGASAASRTVSFIIPTATTYNIGALAGADALEISNNTLSIGANNANSSMTGTITGTGGNITKVGSGTLTLQNTTSTYSGTTRVSAGTLRVETSANSLGTSTVDMAGGNLSLAANTGQTFGRNTIVSSNSTITIDRTAAGADVNHTMGTLSIGAQTLNVAKGSSINAGSTGGLIFGAATLTASGATFNTASETALTLASVGGSGFSFTVAGSGNTTVSGAIATGAGSVTKTGSGTLILSGANSYSGGTLVSAGSLSGSTTSLQGAITNNGNVIISQSTNGTYSGTMTGVGGALTKSGTGTVTMTAANTFSGATTVEGGRLLVNGTNANSAVTINTGASLGGSGRVGDLTVSGLLAPGNSVGSLSAGNTIFNTNGSFELEIFNFTGSAGTGWDLLTVNGDLTLSNTALSPFTINLVSMSATNTAGSAINFNANQSYTNTFLTYSGSLLGNAFATNLLTLNTNSFANALNGAFSIANLGQSLALVYTTSYVPPSSFTWSAGSGLWSDTNNWTEASAPTAGAGIVFAGAGGGNSSNNQVDSVSGLNFSNTAGSFTVSGNAMTNGADGVVNNSANAQIINNDLALGAVQTFNAASGDLTFGGAITNKGNLLTVSGAANTAINGIVSGNGGLTKSGAGSLTLGGDNTFTGTLAANVGTVVVNGTQATAAVNVAGGTLLLGKNNVLSDSTALTFSTGTVNFGGFSDTVSTFNQSGGVFTNGTLTATTYSLSGGTVGGALGVGTANVTGSVLLSGTIDAAALNVNTGGTLTLAANDRIGNSSAVTVNAGTLAMTNF